jgi:hypothetical protein
VDKVRTSLKLAKGSKLAIGRMCLEQGLGLRGKSAWINGALKHFLQQPNWVEMAIPLAQSALPGEAEPVVLDPGLYLDLWEGAVRLSRALYELDPSETVCPDISLVARAAIAWQLSIENKS